MNAVPGEAVVWERSCVPAVGPLPCGGEEPCSRTQQVCPYSVMSILPSCWIQDTMISQEHHNATLHTSSITLSIHGDAVRPVVAVKAKLAAARTCGEDAHPVGGWCSFLQELVGFFNH
ncbi:hypothetical protein CesoFtcFv8_013308 [Champsocephalus esox]|uniref:Uncharacterized protein n=1 Tax=Champsocephalus esox TaxID=159716 RepID=A0AAN8BZ87_9TELE|nr:hypothetical protein CesoFtcFv8_013308 [Champsocephalus esox]